MKERTVLTTAAHRAFRDDAIELLRKHAGALDAKDMLALSAHLCGQIIAMQDQRTMLPATAMEIVARNIEIGNADAISQISETNGSA